MLKTVTAMRYITPLREGGSLPAIVEADDGEMYVTLISFADKLHEADAALRPLLTPVVIRDIINLIPNEWLNHEPDFANPTEHREAYVEYLLNRLEASSIFVEEAVNAHTKLV